MHTHTTRPSYQTCARAHAPPFEIIFTSLIVRRLVLSSKRTPGYSIDARWVAQVAEATLNATSSTLDDELQRQVVAAEEQAETAWRALEVEVPAARL